MITSSWCRVCCVAGIVFALSPLGGGAALAGTTHTLIPFSGFGVVNACNGEGVPFAGEVDIIVHGNQNGGGTHVVISDNAHGTGTGNQANDYILSAQGTGQFDVAAVDGVYLVPFHAEIISVGAAPNFAIDGIDTVVVSSGQVTGFFVSSVTSSVCHG
jgi:hypothetical protein